MIAGDWGVGYAKTLGAFINGNAMTERDRTGAPIIDDSFFLMFNSYGEPMEFKLPPKKWGRKWTIVLDTADPATLSDSQIASIRRARSCRGTRDGRAQAHGVNRSDC